MEIFIVVVRRGVPVVRGMKFCDIHNEVLLDICETLFSVSGVLYSVAIPCTDKSSSCFRGIKREDEVANKYLNRRERTYTNPHRIPFMELTEVILRHLRTTSQFEKKYLAIFQ